MYTLIKKTLETLHECDIDATPSNYAKEFFKQAHTQNIETDEQKKLQSIIKTLTQTEKDLINNNKITTASELLEVLQYRVSNDELLIFISHLAQFLKPSIDQSTYSEAEQIEEQLKQNPQELIAQNTINKISTITNKRVTLDRKALIDKSDDMKKLTTLLSKYYDKSLIQSSNTSDEVKVIKKEIEQLELSDFSSREITNLQKQLVDTIYKLENSIEKNKMDLIKGQDQCSAFEMQIKQLQIELAEVKKEKVTDYLTGVLNRRGFEMETLKFENEYKIFDANYAIIFYDIDDFKKVNDQYGHDCGDVILNTFGNILNKLTRENDAVARYGGEEFVALLHYKNEDEIKRYAQRVKEIITKNKFVYKDSVKIKLKFSAGIALRGSYDTSKEAIKKADLLLYEAKHSGKDKMIFDNGLVV